MGMVFAFAQSSSGFKSGAALCNRNLFFATRYGPSLSAPMPVKKSRYHAAVKLYAALYSLASARAVSGLTF